MANIRLKYPMAMRCPICKRVTTARDDPAQPNRFFPFCSDRCQLIDLGRWIKGDYQIPVRADPDDDAPSSPQQSEAAE